MQQLQNRMTLQEAKERAPTKKQWYEGLLRANWYLPAYNARICTNEFFM